MVDGANGHIGTPSTPTLVLASSTANKAARFSFLESRISIALHVPGAFQLISINATEIGVHHPQR